MTREKLFTRILRGAEFCLLFVAFNSLPSPIGACPHGCVEHKTFVINNTTGVWFVGNCEVDEWEQIFGSDRAREDTDSPWVEAGSAHDNCMFVVTAYTFFQDGGCDDFDFGGCVPPCTGNFNTSQPGTPSQPLAFPMNCRAGG
jgi:hypothetical protein